MSRRDIPNNLKELQNVKRQETLMKIQEAIDNIHEDNDIVTKKKLMDLTGLSSATFSKPHVIQLLKENKVCQFKNTIKINANSKVDEIGQLQKKIAKLEKENTFLQSKLQDKDIKIGILKEDYKKLNSDYELILGKLHIILKRIDMLEIDVGIDLDEL